MTDAKAVKTTVAKTATKPNGAVMIEAVKEMSIVEACAAIDYTPDAKTWSKKTDKEKWSMIKAKRIERRIRDARKALATANKNGEFANCSDAVKEAINALTAVAERTGNPNLGAKNVFMDNINELFKKVGDKVSELDMFIKTKMGRGEIRAKVRENLINATPEKRTWLQMDKDGNWTLIGLGADQPKAWTSKAIDK